MAKTLKEKMKTLNPKRQSRIEARAAKLIAEEQTLRDLRHALHLTQERMAEFLNIRQDNVSRIEQRTDLLISTLRSYIEAMGGKLHLVAEFPNRPPVELSGLSAVESEPRTERRRKQTEEEARV
jgi:transcriptional regulator with XRE-family HTH domain